MATLVTARPQNPRPPLRTSEATAAGPGLTPIGGGGYRLNPEGPIPQPKPANPAATGPNAPTAAAPPLNITAQDDPRLTALSSRYNKYLDSYEKGAGGAMDLAASRFRDAREGLRQGLRTSASLSGGAPADLGSFDAATLQGENKAIADVAAQREANLGEAIRGGLPITAAPGESNRADRRFGLDTWMAQQGAAQNAWERERTNTNDAFTQFLALLNASRQGPLPAGVPVPGGVPGAPPPIPIGGIRPGGYRPPTPTSAPTMRH